MTEYTVELVEARRDIGHMMIAAAYGDVRYVIRRYGIIIGFFGGIGDLERLHAYESGAPAHKPEEPRAPLDPLDQLRQMHARGEPIPTARTPEERELEFKLAMEIGERLMREAEMKAKA